MRFHSFGLLGVLSVALAAASACGGGKVTQASSGAGGSAGTGGGTGGATTSSSTTTSSSSGIVDAGADVDNGMVSTTYPATFPPPPQADSLGGSVATSPRFVPVFFSNEDATLQAGLTDFLAKIGATNYWKETTSEYGVGPATSTAPVILTEAAPTTTDDNAIQTWLTGKLNGNDPAWPVPDDNTIYVLHYPSTTSITMQGGSSCQDFGGYHNDTQLDAAHGQQPVAYAAVPQCQSFDGLHGINAITGAESHELIEAATDPQPQTNTAYSYPDEAHFYYMFALGGGEVGDLCAQNPGVFTKFPELAYEVQRTWSNASVSAGHDPCVPEALGEVYAAASPVQTDDLSFTYQGVKVAMKGVKIPMGQSKTIDIDLYSEADTGGPFTVQAVDYSALFTGKPALTLSLDRTSGQNGEKLHLTITPIANGSFAIPPIWSFESEIFALVVQNGQTQSFVLGLVGN